MKRTAPPLLSPPPGASLSYAAAPGAFSRGGRVGGAVARVMVWTDGSFGALGDAPLALAIGAYAFSSGFLATASYQTAPHAVAEAARWRGRAGADPSETTSAAAAGRTMNIAFQAACLVGLVGAQTLRQLDVFQDQPGGELTT